MNLSDNYYKKIRFQLYDEKGELIEVNKGDYIFPFLIERPLILHELNTEILDSGENIYINKRKESIPFSIHFYIDTRKKTYDENLGLTGILNIIEIEFREFLLKLDNGYIGYYLGNGKHEYYNIRLQGTDIVNFKEVITTVVASYICLKGEPIDELPELNEDEDIENN